MRDAKIKVIIKRPDEKAGHVTNISASLKNLQKTVEGNIETVSEELPDGRRNILRHHPGDGDHLRRIRRRRRLRRRSDRLRDMEAMPESLGK